MKLIDPATGQAVWDSNDPNAGPVPPAPEGRQWVRVDEPGDTMAPRRTAPGILDIGNGVTERLAFLNQTFNPVEGIGSAMRAGSRMVAPDQSYWDRIASLGEMASGVAGIAAPMAAAKAIGVPAASAMMEGLLGFSPAQKAAGDTMRAVGRDVVERLNQPGQMPTVYSNPIPGVGRPPLTFDEVDRAMQETQITPAAAPVDTSYRMQQQPRGPQDDLPIRLDDLTKSTTGEQAGYPADFYSANGPRFYAPGPQFSGDEFGQANRESYRAIMAVRGKPDAEVTIYRAVPNDPNITTINEGDFVTLSPTYAKLHGASGYGRSGDEPGKIISQKVKVRDIYFDGNDVNEFGFFPVTPTRSSVQDIEGTLQAKYPDVKLSISGSPERGYTLNKIDVPKGKRESGIGTAVMNDLVNLADQQGAVLKLSPSGDFGGSVPRLKDFYARFGFVQNKGRNADYAISESMYRNPASVVGPQ